MLLPHGYEGQGPEHSSARLERYLQLAADYNVRIANCTTAAQYFHLLRQQSHLLRRDPRPLIVMTPKSLLRHPLAMSSLDDLASGRFYPVLDDSAAAARPETIRRVVFVSGRLWVDLSLHLAAQADGVALVRLEQLYPFPEAEVQTVLRRYSRREEVIWVQEEPHNMGAWSYIEPRLSALLPRGVVLKYVGRPDRAATAEGFPEMHEQEQARIIREALGVQQLSAQGGQR
jgi:2-oxoglutarate dehydrogenase E1 component